MSLEWCINPCDLMVIIFVIIIWATGHVLDSTRSLLRNDSRHFYIILTINDFVWICLLNFRFRIFRLLNRAPWIFRYRTADLYCELQGFFYSLWKAQCSNFHLATSFVYQILQRFVHFLHNRELICGELLLFKKKYIQLLLSLTWLACLAGSRIVLSNFSSSGHS